MYVNKDSEATFWESCLWFWPHTQWGSLTSGQQHREAQRLSGEAIANVGEVQTSLPLQTTVSGSGHRAQRSHIFPPQPWVKTPTHPAITPPLVNGVFPRVHTILEVEVPRQRARIAVWTPPCNTAVLEQGGALTLPKSQHYHQTTLLPAPGGRGSEWYFLVFAIKSKHHVLVKNKMISMFRILPSTWHLRLSIKCFAAIARLQTCHLFLITALNDSIEIKYKQV